MRGEWRLRFLARLKKDNGGKGGLGEVLSGEGKRCGAWVGVLGEAEK